MKFPSVRLSGRGMAVVRAAAEAGKQDRFTLRELFPLDAAQRISALCNALECGAVERIIEATGVWFYRLTESGREAAKKPKRNRKRAKTQAQG